MMLWRNQADVSIGNVVRVAMNGLQVYVIERFSIEVVLNAVGRKGQADQKS